MATLVACLLTFVTRLLLDPFVKNAPLTAANTALIFAFWLGLVFGVIWITSIRRKKRSPAPSRRNRNHAKT